MRRAHRRMLNEVAIIGPGATSSTNRDRALLQEAIQSSPLSYGDLAAVHQVLGFFDGVDALRKGDHSSFLTGVLPLVTHRWGTEGHIDGIHKDGVISNGFHLLAEQYSKLGAWAMASEFYTYATMTATFRQRQRFDRHSALTATFLTRDDDLIENFEELLSEGVDAPTTLLLSMLQRSRTGRSEEILSALSDYDSFLDTRRPGQTVGLGYLLEYLLASANEACLHDEVIRESGRWLTKLSGELGPELLGVRQHRARALLIASETPKAQAEADTVVQIAKTLETLGCSDDVWDGLRQRHSLARYVRLQAALHSRDLISVQRYLLEDHLVGRAATIIEIDHTFSLSKDAGDDDPPRDEPVSEGSKHVPAALMWSWDDVLNAHTIIETTGSATAVVEGILWLLSPHGDSIFWSVAEDNVVLAAGAISLAEESELADVLKQFHSKYTPERAEKDTETWLSQSLEADLSVADGFAELSVTTALGRLMPAILRERLLRVQQNSDRPRLTIGPSYEIPALPWPILNLVTASREARRLIEVADVGFWLSARVQDAKAANYAASVGPYPLLTVVDSLDRSGVSVHKELAEKAIAPISWQSRETGQANREYLEAVHTKRHHGVFFYRGHLHHEWAGSSATAYIEIPGRDEEERLYAAQLFGHYDSGASWFPMPARVVLSCCSSAAGYARYEALSFAAASIVGGGAVDVVATAIDVDDTPFTDAFEERLAMAVCDKAPVFHTVSEIQRAMLAEWRLFSLRGGADDLDAILRAPHPLIWAMYRNY